MLVVSATCCTLAYAQAPVANVDPSHHGNLAAAQQSIMQAYVRIGEAQRENDAHLGGHAQKAKELLTQANDEIRAAADVADGNGGPFPGPASPDSGPPAASVPSAPVDLSGNWTIYSQNVNQPGSSLEQIQLSQHGSIITGTFHGPHQHGKLQGWVNGNHVEFSTDTNDVLTFRGDISPTGMSGIFAIHGERAPWRAERSN